MRKIQKIFSEAGLEFDNDVEVFVPYPKYMEELHTLLAKTPERVLGKLIDVKDISILIELKY